MGIDPAMRNMVFHGLRAVNVSMTIIECEKLGIPESIYKEWFGHKLNSEATVYYKRLWNDEEAYRAMAVPRFPYGDGHAAVLGLGVGHE